MYHIPVLLQPSIEGLNINPNGVYVDVTFGGGGHARAILERLQNGRLIAFDQDADAAINLPDDERITFVPHNFRYMRNFLMLHQLPQVDGILADLGVSSHQFDKAEKGFSTRFDGPLDMRMDTNSDLTAAYIVNSFDEDRLRDILQEYGELSQARKMAARIVVQRQSRPLKTTFDLIDAVTQILPKGKENKVLAQLFQALRIEVNQEMEALKAFLQQCHTSLKPGGRLVVISYHSLEDRLVKHYMKSGNFQGHIGKDFYGNPITPFKLVSRKAIVAESNETETNSRARSARLRIAERKTDET